MIRNLLNWIVHTEYRPIGREIRTCTVWFDTWVNVERPIRTRTAQIY